MSNVLYDKGRNAFLTGGVNWTSDTIKIALVSSSYTPDTANDQYWSTVNTYLVNSAQTLASTTATAGVADAADVTFSAVSSGSTVKYLVIYKDTGTASTSPLIALIDSYTGLPFSTSGSDVTVVFDNGSNKIFKL